MCGGEEREKMEKERGGGRCHTIQTGDGISQVKRLDHGEVAGIAGEEHLLLVLTCLGKAALVRHSSAQGTMNPRLR